MFSNFALLEKLRWFWNYLSSKDVEAKINGLLDKEAEAVIELVLFNFVVKFFFFFSFDSVF